MAEIAGPYTSMVYLSLSFTDWWLKDITDPTLNYIPLFQGSVLKRGRHEEQATFSPLGRSRNVVLRGVQRGEELTLPFEAITPADYTKFEAIRAVQRTLLLQRGYTNEQWYIALGAERDINEAGFDPNYKLWEVKAIEVDAP